MPRPEMTAEELADLNEGAEKSFDHPDTPSHMKYATGEYREILKEMFMAGEWLWRKLKHHGADDKEAHNVCFAHGQRCFGKRDYWLVAQECFDRWYQGRADVPGQLLAEQITADTFGGEFATRKQEVDRRRKELYDKFTKFVD